MLFTTYMAIAMYVYATIHICSYTYMYILPAVLVIPTIDFYCIYIAKSPPYANIILLL